MGEYECFAQRPAWAVAKDGIDAAGLARAQRVIEFIELLNVPSGEGQGKPIKLRPWQKQFIIDVYAPNSGGRRRVRRAVFSVARKNGKTALIAALVICHLVGPEAIPNGEIYSAATDREQAGQVFKFCKQIIEMEPEFGPGGSSPITIVPSTKTLVCKANGSFYRAMSAEAGTKHGLNPSLWIYDELAQARDQELYEVMNTSQGAREEPLGIVISTQSPDPEHPLSKLIDDGLVANDPNILVHLYAVPEDVEDIFEPSVWRSANPALGDFRSIDDLTALAVQAERMPSLENAFANLYCNQRVDIHAPLITRTEWKACQTGKSLKKGEPIYLALDLSGKVDLTSLVGVSAEPGVDRVGAWHWKPKEYLADHSKRDNFDYVTQEKEGWLTAVPGRIIDYSYIAQEIARIRTEYDVVGMAYDRWRMDLLMVEFGRIGLESYVDGVDDARDGALRLVKWGQGYNDMSPAVEALEESVVSRKFQHDGNPVLGFCFANAITTSDAAGNRKLDKAATRFRIDGAVATAMALGLKYRDLVEDKGPPIDDFLNNPIMVI